MRLKLGSPVWCSDGPFGELGDVVIDPFTRRVTHLVVEPRHRHALARLVPVELARAEDGSRPGVSLACTVEQVRRLAPVQESAYLRLYEFPVGDPDFDVGVQNVLAAPHFGYTDLEVQDEDPHVVVSYDRIPKGEVEIRRKSAVTSTDDRHLGHVEGLLVDAGEGITHVVLERGHAWGRREVTIPIGAVARVEMDSIRLSLAKDAVGALPSLPVHRWLA